MSSNISSTSNRNISDSDSSIIAAPCPQCKGTGTIQWQDPEQRDIPAPGRLTDTCVHCHGEGDQTLTIVLPLPATALMPNARAHYRPKAKATADARLLAAQTAVIAGYELFGNTAPPEFPLEEAVAAVTWKLGGRRSTPPDRDNALAACKAYFDGLTDAGLLTDDRGLIHLPLEVLPAEPKVPGELTIRIAPITPYIREALALISLNSLNTSPKASET